MRIAFFGGSFDPPHLAHLAIARAAVQRLHLDRVLLTPAGLQPFKHTGSPSSYADRMAMATLMVEESHDPAIEVSALEVSAADAPRADGLPNYTYDTVKQLRDSLPPADKLFFLVGADSFLSLHSWHRAAELLPLVHWIVASRPGFDLDLLASALPEGFTLAPPPTPSPAGVIAESGVIAEDAVIADDIYDANGYCCSLFLMPDLQEDISATWVRTTIANGRANNFADAPAVAPGVAQYIRQHGLYRDSPQR